MASTIDSSKGVRFAEDQSQPPARPAGTTTAAAGAAASPASTDVRLGFLLVGGIYACDLLEFDAAPPSSASSGGGGSTPSQPAAAGAGEAQPTPAPSPALPPPLLPHQQLEVRGLSASNLSVSVEPQPGSSGDGGGHGGGSSGGGGSQRVVLRVWAEREGPLQADFVLVLGQDQEVAVHVTATVFSRRKGTPGLKPHVRCLGFSADTETEAASDWQGF